jgi:serine protease Do
MIHAGIGGRSPLARKGRRTPALRTSECGRIGCPKKRDSGLVIIAVDPNSAADERGLKPNDIILEADGRNLSNVEDLRQVVEEVRSKNRNSLLVKVMTAGESRFVAVSLKGMP